MKNKGFIEKILLCTKLQISSDSDSDGPKRLVHWLLCITPGTIKHNILNMSMNLQLNVGYWRVVLSLHIDFASRRLGLASKTPVELCTVSDGLAMVGLCR